MTREMIKEILPILQAFADGKTIQSRCIKGDKTLWYDDDDFSFDDDLEYRIKPEPIYRPFKDAEECWNEMQKHKPFGWCKTEEGNYYPITSIAANDDFNSSFNNFTFADGSVFGVKEGGDI